MRKLVIPSLITGSLLMGACSSMSIAPGKGPGSSQTPYLQGKSGWESTALLTVGDKVGNYAMVGIPDGLGAYLNEKNELVVLMNHEFGNNAGEKRAHGEKGALVSEWRFDTDSLKPIAGADLVRKTMVWKGSRYVAMPTSFGRLCSADLPEVSAFYNAKTSLGTQSRIFMNGEENGPIGRAFAHVATGSEAGTSYELPVMANASWENVLAAPYEQDATILIGLDDTHPKANDKSKLDPAVGKLYVYVGSKQKTGNEIDKAGLTGGILYNIQVGNGGLESRAQALSGRFSLVFNGGTNFLRPEDGAWDPKQKGVFYFATTDRLTTVADADGAGRSRIYKLTFDDISKPEKGGKIEALLTGTEGYEMLDNLTVGSDGRLYLQEDVGGNPRLGKVWALDPTTRKLEMIAEHDAARFTKGAAGFLTEDEESSGIIEITDLLVRANKRFADGRRYMLASVQAHRAMPGELVEDGQLVLLASPAK